MTDLVPGTALEPISSRTPAGRPAALAFVNDPNSEEVLKTAFREETPGAVLRGDIAKAIEYLSDKRSPRVLIVDITDVELPVTEVHRLADVCEPGVSVIVVGTRDEVGLYRDLLQAGVADYLVKPLTDNLIAKALNVARGGPDPVPISRKLGKLIAFVGARGGVGTSTMAVNLAWYLANRQARRVALIDLDLQSGVCGLLLNVPASGGLRDALEHPSRVDSLFLERTMIQHGERLYVLNSEEPFEQELEFPENACDQLCEVLREHFHYIIADIPGLLDPNSRRLLEIADVRVIVLDQTLQSIRDAARLSKLNEGNAQQNIIVLNRAGEAGRHAIKVDEVGAALEQRVRCLVPYQPAILAAAAERGNVAASSGGRFADAIAGLAREISGQTPQKTSRWRLFG